VSDTVLEFSQSGSLDPDDLLVQRGLDPQTGRLKSAVAVSTRGRAAAALRVNGAPYEEIAETLEYASPSEARKAVEEVLAATVDETRDYASLRALASLRLEGLLKAVAPRAMDENDPDQLGFHRAASSVVDRWIKLHGLDAPQRIAMITPSSEEFERVIATMLAHADTGGSAEADIFALEGVQEAEWSDVEDGPIEEGAPYEPDGRHSAHSEDDAPPDRDGGA
jgi:hypothetical protein